MKTFLCQAVLFDLDGVLVDSTRLVERLWRFWAKEHNIDPEVVLDIVHGRRTAEIIRLLAPDLDVEAEVTRVEHHEAQQTNGMDAMPGAAVLLGSLPDSRWAVVTSGTSYLANSRLRHANLPIPKVLVSADQVRKGKPHPEPYLMGARLLGIPPDQCLVMEDAPAGIESAHAAGMKAIGLTSTFPARELNADAVIADLRYLTAEFTNGLVEFRISE